MKISTKGRYALRMLIDLAQHQGEGYIALKDIAARQNISKNILSRLCRFSTDPIFSILTEAIRAATGLQKLPKITQSAIFFALPRAVLLP